MASQRGRKEKGAILSAASLGREVPAGATLLLDTSVLIAYFDRTEQTSVVAAAVVEDFIGAGRNRALVSMATVTELLVRPLRVPDVVLAGRILEFLTHFPNLKLGVIDLPVAREAALLRARLGLGASDALIVATGLVDGCRHIVSNDREWSTKFARSGPSASIVLLDDHLPFPA